MATNTPGISPNGVGAVDFSPSLPGNAVFLAVYTVLLVIHIFTALWLWRSYGYSVGMVGGILLELVGYIGKVKLSHNRADTDGYIMYIIGLTLGPTFLSASLYLGITTLQIRYSAAQFSHVGPRMFSTLFILGDFICLCFIGCGGSLAAIYAWSPIGIDLMIAGLAVQVIFTAIFGSLLGIICRRVWYKVSLERKQPYVFGSALAALCLFVRSCWRAAELSGGFNGTLASKEGLFFALDSVPVVIMAVTLTLVHPDIWMKAGNDRLVRIGGIKLGSV